MPYGHATRTELQNNNSELFTAYDGNYSPCAMVGDVIRNLTSYSKRHNGKHPKTQVIDRS